MGDPFTTLGARVDGVQADRDFALQVLPDSFFSQRKCRAGFLVGRPEVIVTPAHGVRAHRLEGVRPPINEQPEVIVDHLRRRLE